MSIDRTLILPGPPTREATIDRTVIRARDGDPEAFARLYDAHAPRIHALCLRLTGDGERASGLLQDVFVRAWQRLGSFRGDSAFGTWLHRLAVNVVFESARGEQRRHRRVISESTLAAALPDLPTLRDQPELRLDLDQAIAALQPTLREVFVLHDVEGFRHEEIATTLGIPVATSRSHLFRARRLLREALS